MKLPKWSSAFLRGERNGDANGDLSHVNDDTNVDFQCYFEGEPENIEWD
jgi:hypothetical protein